jgi:dTDP-glucose pyrophosphorylase
MHKVLQPDDRMTCGAGVPVRDVLGQISATPFVAQIVVDEARRVVGVMTDGDIRRALLRGLDLDRPVREVMNDRPMLGRVGEDGRNAEALHATRSVARFLPILDAEGRLACVWISAAARPSSLTALVMAGGLGSRLGERTATTPKPLLPVAGKPIMEHVLTRLEDAGVGLIYVSVHYLAHRIEEFLRERASRADIRVLHEAQRLGTAGALGILPERPTGPVLVLNGDVLTQADFSALEAFHHRHEHDATIAVAHHHVRVPYGVVRHDETGQFQGIDEKPVLRNFVAAGIYCVGPEVVTLAPPNARMDMPELLNESRRAGLRVGLFPIHEYWADVGRPEDLEAADAYHRNAK